jgi:hypothetical protein
MPNYGRIIGEQSFAANSACVRRLFFREHLVNIGKLLCGYDTYRGMYSDTYRLVMVLFQRVHVSVTFIVHLIDSAHVTIK